VNTWCPALAKELAPRSIRVSTIRPGPIDNSFQHNVERVLTEIIGRHTTQFCNEMIPLGRHGTPQEIAKSVLYLASDQSSFTTGAMLMVDRGRGPWRRGGYPASVGPGIPPLESEVVGIGNNAARRGPSLEHLIGNALPLAIGDSFLLAGKA